MILIKGGRIINPQAGVDLIGDLLVEKDKIKDIQKPGVIKAPANCKVIDASSKWVVPGLIDIHVHLREPGYEWKETVATGGIAAVGGGFTTICCMPNTNPVNDSAEVTEYILEKARLAGAAKVCTIGAVSIASKGETLAPLSELKHAGCVAFSDDGHAVQDELLMRRALEWCSMIDAPIACHEAVSSLDRGASMNESEVSFRLGLGGMPTLSEDIMVARDIELARFTGGKVHICHISSARSVELVRRAKNDGVAVTAEATPHHLILTEDKVSDYDTNYKMHPPLRTEEDQAALLEGLKEGVVDVVASDHAPHEADSKNLEFGKASNGIIGLQTTLPLVLDLVRKGSLSINRAIEALTSKPSSIFNLERGSLEKGSVADVTVIDPELEWNFNCDNVLSKSKNSPFLGRDLVGIADTVIVDGKIVLEERKLGNAE